MKPSIYKSRELSPRCVEVLVLISEGQTDNEIAKLLGITTNTVAGYVRVIMDKLNAKSRAHAVGIWFK